MNIYAYFSALVLFAIGLTLVQCTHEPTHPSLIALNAIIEEAETSAVVSQTLIPIDQSPIPRTEEFRTNAKSSISKLLSKKDSHLPTSIRIPDPVIRELARKKILTKIELQSILTQLSTLSNTAELNRENGIDFNQPYHLLDSIGYDAVDAYTLPLLVNDKLIVAKVTTQGISNYKAQQPRQTTTLNVYQSSQSEESTEEKNWEVIYQKNIR